MWIANCTSKSDEYIEDAMRRWQWQEMQSSVETSLSILYSCYLFVQLVTHACALSNPFTNTPPVLLKIPGSKHVSYLHFHDSTTYLTLNLVVNDHCVALTAVMGTVNIKGVL